MIYGHPVAQSHGHVVRFLKQVRLIFSCLRARSSDRSSLRCLIFAQRPLVYYVHYSAVSLRYRAVSLRRSKGRRAFHCLIRHACVGVLRKLHLLCIVHLHHLLHLLFELLVVLHGSHQHLLQLLLLLGAIFRIMLGVGRRHLLLRIPVVHLSLNFNLQLYQVTK